MEYFGLNNSFQWSDEKIQYYVSLYKSEMEVDEMVNNKITVFHINSLINKIDQLGESASSEGCSGDFTVVDQEMLGELLKLSDCIKHLQQQLNANTPSSSSLESSIKFSTDGGASFEQKHESEIVA
jgi:hypothetical protein